VLGISRTGVNGKATTTIAQCLRMLLKEGSSNKLTTTQALLKATTHPIYQALFHKFFSHIHTNYLNKIKILLREVDREVRKTETALKMAEVLKVPLTVE